MTSGVDESKTGAKVFIQDLGTSPYFKPVVDAPSLLPLGRDMQRGGIFIFVAT